MTLKDFLDSLKTKGVLVTVIDSTDTEICKLYAEGIDALDDAIEAKTVTKWSITGSTALSVIIAD